MKHKLFYGVVCSLIFLTACKKKVQPDMGAFNENCDCVTEVSTDFLMEELASQINTTGFKMQTDTDTMYADRNVRFYAQEPNATYTWIIGAETITEREFYRYFDASLIGQTLDMKLIVQKAPNSICLPGDDGIDTIIRKLTIAPDLALGEFHTIPNPRFEGVFRMKEINGVDSIDITCDINNIPGTWAYKITNYDGQGSEITQQHFGYNYRQFWFSGTCFGLSNLQNKINGEVELFLTPNSSGSCQEYHYTGRKLN
ncbi:MAG: hypothetical protein ACJA1C_002453 [Crocinitomicaceae bacterium]|jgi:hypothetical protein